MRGLFFKIFIIFWIAQSLIFVISTALIVRHRFQPSPDVLRSMKRAAAKLCAEMGRTRSRLKTMRDAPCAAQPAFRPHPRSGLLRESREARRACATYGQFRLPLQPASNISFGLGFRMRRKSTAGITICSTSHFPSSGWRLQSAGLRLSSSCLSSLAR
jgi:hypothetical protein